jgi:dihydroorotase-like cyclic amidohydrolase
MNQLFQQVRVIDPIALTDRVADVLVIDGVIEEVSPATQLPTDLTIIPAQNLILAPGLVDLYSYSGTPGHEERETIESLLLAAQSGGFVSVNILPDTLPALDRASSIISLDREYRQIAAQIPNCPQLGYWGALTEGVAGKAMSWRRRRLRVGRMDGRLPILRSPVACWNISNHLNCRLRCMLAIANCAAMGLRERELLRSNMDCLSIR